MLWMLPHTEKKDKEAPCLCLNRPLDVPEQNANVSCKSVQPVFRGSLQRNLKALMEGIAEIPYAFGSEVVVKHLGLLI